MSEGAAAAEMSQGGEPAHSEVWCRRVAEAMVHWAALQRLGDTLPPCGEGVAGWIAWVRCRLVEAGWISSAR
jgi:hypothetical protein